MAPVEGCNNSTTDSNQMCYNWSIPLSVGVFLVEQKLWEVDGGWLMW